MGNYLLRRGFQMLIVLFFSSAATYALLNIAPGGPLQGLRQQQNSATRTITAEDIARIRARFELDLYLPYRFTRWLVGWPRGPIIVGGQAYLADMRVGCRIEVEGSGCQEYVTMADLVGRRTSNGV